MKLTHGLSKLLVVAMTLNVFVGITPIYAANGDKSVVVAGSLQDELGGSSDWNPADTATKMVYQDGWYILKGKLPAGNYEYKVAVGGTWDESYGMNAIAGGDNIPLKLEKESEVVFAYNDETHIICGGKAGKGEAIAPEKLPRLVGDLQDDLGETNWDPKKAATIFGNVTGTDLYIKKVKLPAGQHEYKVLLGNDFKDESFGVGKNNAKLLLDKETEVVFVFNRADNSVSPDYTAEIAAKAGPKKVVLAGDLQDELGSSAAWDPASEKTEMKDIGNGFYALTGKLPAGSYNYKVAVGGSWAENYGLGGKFDSANLPLSLAKEQNVTFYYHSGTHRIKDSTQYTFLKDSELPKITGSISKAATGEFILRDTMLEKFYSTVLDVKAGTYDINIEQKGKVVAKQKITVAKSRKISIYFDFADKKIIVDDGSVQADKLYHNTWDNNYRKPFEALKAGEEITLSIHGNKGDIKNAKLVLIKSKLSTGGGDEYNIDYSEGKSTTYDMSFTGNKAVDNEEVDVWSKTLRINENGIYGYKFIINDTQEYGEDASPGRIGAAVLKGAAPFQLTVYSRDYKTPDWMKEAIVYQIFPDRFANGNTGNDNNKKTSRGNQPIQNKAWNDLPANSGSSPELDQDTYDTNDFFGGDLAGITKNLDYLQQLGITAVYVNPIMEAGSNHKYDTINYEHIDSMFGTPEEFNTLTTEMNKRGMELIMDGVFNHVGDDSIYFDRYGKYEWVGAYEYWSRVYDLMNSKKVSQKVAEEKAAAELIAEGQKFSEYNFHKWFDIKNQLVPDEVNKGQKRYYYKPWQGATSLAPFKELTSKEVKNAPVKDAASELNNKDLSNYLLYNDNSIIKHWFKEGLSGWRFDVAKEVSPEFWKEVRKEVKKLKTLTGKEPLILGEVLQDSSQFFTGDQFDSVMNYKLRFALVELFLGNGDAKAADTELKILMQNYPKEAFYALMNIVDTHDTARAIYSLGGGKGTSRATLSDFDYKLGKERLKLALAFVMGYPGAPTIYYGDEAGLYGSGDPDSRRPYQWDNQDQELLDYYKAIVKVRTDHKKLFVYGDVYTLQAEGDIYIYGRTYNKEHAVVAINRGEKAEFTIDASQFKEGTLFIDALDTSCKQAVKDGKLVISLEKGKARMLIAN